jgi:hypothetical protein
MRPLYLGGNLDFPFVNVCLEPNVSDAPMSAMQTKRYYKFNEAICLVMLRAAYLASNYTFVLVSKSVAAGAKPRPHATFAKASS